jgi:cytochrome oxidase Cu insertion factor (SCO1/SenC/PrrC family)
VNDLARLQHLRDTLLPDGVEYVAVTVDPRDTEEMLGNYASTHQPATRLVIVPPDQRSTVLGLFAKVFGGPPPMPSSVVTDGEGHILGIQTGLPRISTLRKILVDSN